MTWLSFIPPDLLIYAGAAMVALLGILGFGAKKKRQGAKEAENDFIEQDRARADGLRKRVRNADRVQPSDIIYRD